MTFPVRLGIVPLEIHYLDIAPVPTALCVKVLERVNHAACLEMFQPFFQGGVGIFPRPDH